MAKLPPAPVQSKDKDSAVWQEWFRQVRDQTNIALLTATWGTIDFTSSNITDIVTRNHNNLQNFNGGASGEYYHLTLSQHTQLTNSIETSLHFHIHNGSSGLQGGTSSQYYNLTSTEYTGTGSGVFVRQSDPKITTMLTLPKTSGAGIKVDTTTPTFGWRDIIGTLKIRIVGANDPVFNSYNGTSVRQFQFSNAIMNEIFHEYHIPHDYVPGSDVHVHVHWSQTTVDTGGAAGAPGVVKYYFDALYSKGHNQEAFPAAVTTVSVTQTASATVRQHMITEVQLTTSGALGGNNLEPDGVIILRMYRDPADAADTLDQGPFVHFVDLHYQSTNMATKQKAPNFYT